MPSRAARYCGVASVFAIIVALAVTLTWLIVKEHKDHRPKTGTPSVCRDVTKRIKLGLASQRINELACGDFSKYVCGGWSRPDLVPGVQAEAHAFPRLEQTNWTELLINNGTGVVNFNDGTTTFDDYISRVISFGQWTQAFESYLDSENSTQIARTEARRLVRDFDNRLPSNTTTVLDDLTFTSSVDVSPLFIVNEGVEYSNNSYDTPRSVVPLFSVPAKQCDVAYLIGTFDGFRDAHVKRVARDLEFIDSRNQSRPFEIEIVGTQDQYLSRAKQLVDFQAHLGNLCLIAVNYTAKPSAEFTEQAHRQTYLMSVEQFEDQFSAASIRDYIANFTDSTITRVEVAFPAYFANLSNAIDAVSQSVLHDYFRFDLFDTWELDLVTSNLAETDSVPSLAAADGPFGALSFRQAVCAYDVEAKLAWLLSAAYDG